MHCRSAAAATVATCAAASATAVTFLQYVLNPPHVVSPEAVLFNNALDEQHSASFKVMTERDLEESELTRWREKNEVDLRLYEIARALDREQRYCFERLTLSKGSTVSIRP